MRRPSRRSPASGASKPGSSPRSGRGCGRRGSHPAKAFQQASDRRPENDQNPPSPTSMRVCQERVCQELCQKSGSVGRPLQRLIRGGALSTRGRDRKRALRRVLEATAQEVLTSRVVVVTRGVGGRPRNAL